MEGIAKGVSVRTVQGDLQIMRSDKLGYYAPIEVYDNKYYRYADPDYSIANTPVSTEDYNLIANAVKTIEEYRENGDIEKLDEMLVKVKNKLNSLLRLI